MEITNPQIRDYIEAVMPERSPILEAMHTYAIANQVPIIKPEMESFLRFMVTMHQPKRMLEIGTAIGFSAGLMLEAAPEGATVTTLEKSPKMIELATNNIKALNLTDQVTIVEGDGVETIKTLKGPYDLIFIDAAKGQYLNYFEDSMRLLKSGGIMVADNILQDGLIAKSRFAIPRRQRTIHGRMRTFVKTLMDHPELTTTVLPIADGATVSIRKTI